MVNEAIGVLGYIKKWSKEFDDRFCPKYFVHKDCIEFLQKKFVILALRGLNWVVN